MFYFATIMATETQLTSSTTKTILPTFSLGLEFLNKAEKERNTGKGESASAPSRFASLSEGEMQKILTERHSGETKQMTNWSVSTCKGKLTFFFVLKLLNIKLELLTGNLKKKKKKTIPIFRNISLTANNHFCYCCPVFASDLTHNSTGYVVKQLVHAFSCALSSYGALGKFGEHSRS